MHKKRLKGLSLFAGAGIGETYFKDAGIDILVANELIKQRADLYKSISPDTDVVCGDITKDEVLESIMNAAPTPLDFLLASPPCQGMSVAGKNRHQKSLEADQRNYLITYVVKAIKRLVPTYVLIENVPTLLKIQLNYAGKTRTVIEMLNLEFGEQYDIDGKVVDSSDYGVPQVRLRAIIKMHKKGTLWNWPQKNAHKVTVREAIGNLPTLEAGEKSNIKWHFARPHSKENVLWMKHTPTGRTAFDNPVYFPQKKDGTPVKGYQSSYRRIRWDVPAPTITMRNDCIASQRNVHPGRELPDGTYSDARVLTPLELMILDSLPLDWNIPDNTPELLIRQCIGESIPPLMLKSIVSGIEELKDTDMEKNDKIKAISLFSSAGIGELLLHNTKVDIIAGNELLPKRAECYQHFYPNAEMCCGDIKDDEIKNHMIDIVKKNNVKMLLATPPCQGLSTLGKNKNQAHYEKDKRNFLVLRAMEIIDACDFDYILIENVPTFLNMYFPFDGEYLKLEEILNKKYSDKYTIDIRVLNAKDYGVCQSRPRAIIKLYKKDIVWGWPVMQPEIPLSEVIGYLPSLEAGQDSGIPWHYAKPQNSRAVLALKHTPTGKSALKNEVYYPKKEDGTKIKGFHNTFKRMTWDEPCPTRTTFSGSMSSHNNVHPGRLLADGTYSDARVLTLLETFIVSSIPENIDFPKNSTDTFIRTVIGEAIPPKLLFEVVNKIGEGTKMPVMVSRDKWILYKHTCNYEMIKAVALDVKNSCKTDVSDLERYRMQERLAALNLYRTRNPEERPLDSINHRINTLEFWMFGYEDKPNGEKRFIFSPLGNLFLKYISDEQKLRKIFIAMMFAIQFQHPANGTSSEFQLYPFRLIFQLLTDKRLDGKLYNYEEELILPFVKKVTPESYEQLISQILSIRNLPDIELVNKLKSDEHTYVNTVYEWEYYTQTLLSQVGIINKVEGNALCKLYHPSKSGSKSLPTGRKATKGYVTISSNCLSFIKEMLAEYTCFATSVRLNDPERLTIDCIKEVYSFYPQLLLREIGESDDLSKLLELPKLIEKYANNPENETAYLFEDVLTKGFNMLYNVEAIKRGGAAHTDIECLYITKKKKFAVESKSTANKLLGINAGRLREQREEIGGEYTIVITSRYVPATKRDIKGTPIVIILANTFAEYLYNHIFHEVRNIDYADFDNIIINNLGTDISGLISNMTLEKFATNS